MTFELFYLHRILFVNDEYVSNILRVFHNGRTFDSGIRTHCNANACIFVHYEVCDKKCVMYRVSHRYGDTLQLNFLTFKTIFEN